MTLAAAAAEAHPSPTPPARSDGEFWRDVVEPHADEVNALVAKTRQAMKIAEDALQTDAEWAVDARMRYYQAALGMMTYARTLAPDNAEVLGLLGVADDELGKTRQAIEAFEACIRVAGAEKAGGQVTGRLGAVYLRMGDRDAGIRWLRMAQGPLTPLTAEPTVQLANALASQGDVTAALDVLASVLPAQGLGYYSHELSLVSFTLALVLDRDEQRSAAFGVLERMKSALAQQFGPQMQTVLATTRFSPAEDQHYYLGLLYEALDQLTEARAEWALYAASGDTPWRGRALDHVRAIDAQRRARPAPAPVAPGAALTQPRRRPAVTP